MMKNTTRGRKKRREIKKIDDPNSRRVTFSKRRAGVFNKASELCILTGAEAAVLCESSSGRFFAFGHPTVESVVDNYLGGRSSSESPENIPTSMLNKQYLEITKELETEVKKSKNVIGEKNNNYNDMEEEGSLFWWQQPFEHLEMEELDEYISSMEKMMNNLTMRADDLRLIKSSSSMFDTNKNSNVDGLDEFLANKNSNMSDDGLDEFFANFEFPGDNVQVSNDYVNEMQVSDDHGNLVLPDDYGSSL